MQGITCAVPDRDPVKIAIKNNCEGTLMAASILAVFLCNWLLFIIARSGPSKGALVQALLEKGSLGAKWARCNSGIQELGS